MSKTFLKNVEGTEIFVDNETGQFLAKVGGKEIKKRNLRDVEKAIDEVSGAVTAYNIERHSPSRARIVEISRFDNDRARLKDGRLMGRFEEFYILTPEQVAEVDRLYNQYKKARDEFSQYTNALPALHSGNFIQERKRQKEARSRES